ncbi:MAG TPA: 16S rRNA (uracil(1498)-N(3))-methyltransferase [Nocardioidaceae bacterium]|nr:16S rRNA (uracil(1498)-N(3))-methyltransferase [Nocardioidaceae bacterium]
MSLPLFLHQGLAGLAPGSSVVLSGDEGRHAVVVRRVRVGEQVALTDGAGTRAVCTVTAVDSSVLHSTVDSVVASEPELPRVVVVQAIPKGDRGELAVEMLTEVGVDVIVPWAAARSVSVWRGDKQVKALARWRSTAREAAKQARRSWFPEVSEVVSTPEVVDLLRDASVPVVLHEAASGPLADLPVPGRGEIVIVVGPEGGISDEELAAFATVGAEPVRLGSSVLRTSTAGVAATAALLARTRWR